ncbi:hypothetical protein [Falsochrobactrum shanghaiense]|uniref:hypothetical protein n=1 Tax=Falsochrobactrum shanghaiense TaxID=2201899 RepID=UPI0011B1CE61|nr:hypothetical protein [Falsochrobactrum shanghaiense]
MTQTPSHRESDANYHGVIAVLNDRWRVTACRDGIQWILQYRAGERNGQSRYDSRSYCRTKEALIRVCRTHAGDISPTAMTVLNNLPERLS